MCYSDENWKGLPERKPLLIMWAHLDSNQGPPDYESGALTNWAIGPAFLKRLQLVFKGLLL